mmetsp:Transcript_30189/g.83029  ORF Transcript_30189/g.83029 Transcript_30189/m.83029 type:complete len:254 (+) Transcript_30189:950-1711(+)
MALLRVARRSERVYELLRRVVPHLVDLDQRLGRLDPHAQPQQVAEAPERVGQRGEEVGIFVARADRDDLARSDEDVRLKQALVHEAMLEGGGFNADANDAAADRDRLELRHDQWHPAVFGRLGHERLEGRRPLDIAPTLVGVDLDNVAERAQVQACLVVSAHLTRQYLLDTERVAGGRLLHAQRARTLRHDLRLLHTRDVILTAHHARALRRAFGARKPSLGDERGDDQQPSPAPDRQLKRLWQQALLPREAS